MLESTEDFDSRLDILTKRQFCMLIKKACPFFIFQTKIHNRATKLCKILEKLKINKSRNRAQGGRQKKWKKGEK